MGPPLRFGCPGIVLAFDGDLDEQRGAPAGGAGDVERAELDVHDGCMREIEPDDDAFG
jgi:hypothetical protein